METPGVTGCSAGSECEAYICGLDTDYCCSYIWDRFCANDAEEICEQQNDETDIETETDTDTDTDTTIVEDEDTPSPVAAGLSFCAPI